MLSNATLEAETVAGANGLDTLTSSLVAFPLFVTSFALSYNSRKLSGSLI